jgi:RimJ/RimL family protein N-acetyltransferase
MQTNEFLDFFRKQHPKPYFTFPDVPPADELSFEVLTPDNFEQLYLLFENDSSPFVDSRFKTYEGAKEYATHLSIYGAYSPKHGSQDWLFLVNDQYAGILHLYDMSLETFAQNHKRAWVGFATKEAFRNQRLTTKTLRHFIKTILEFYPEIDFIHAMTVKENSISKKFLGKNGFQEDLAERLSKAHDFFLLTRSAFQ